jgi:hypothetical protein
MKSETPGGSTSVVEVSQISKHGFWLLLRSGEVFLSFETFPWFRAATIAQIQNVTLLHSQHLYWPDLDIDIAVDSIHHPEFYPLSTKVAANKPVRRPIGAGKVSDHSVGKRRATRR